MASISQKDKVAKLSNKRIYIIKETASRERHTEKNTSAIDNAKAPNIIISTRTC